MATRFPSSLIDRGTYNVDGVQYIYNATTDVFEKAPSAGTYSTSSLLTHPGPGVSTSNALFSNIQYHDDIFAAWNNNTGILQSYNGAMNNTVVHTALNPWNNSSLIQVPIGANSVTTGPGIKITVPAGCDMVWIRNHQGDSIQENRIQYAWNTSANIIGVNRHYGNLGPKARPTPSILGGVQKKETRHNWGLPFYLPDDLGGTLFAAWIPIGNANTVDNWIAGIAFSKNNRNFTATNAIEIFRNDRATSVSQTFEQRWGQYHTSAQNTSTTFTSAPTTIGIPVINKGSDKVFVLNTPTVDARNWEPAPYLRVGNNGGTDFFYVGDSGAGSENFNTMSQALLAHTREGGVNTMSWRIPASFIDKHIPRGTIGELEFGLANGRCSFQVVRTSYAYLLDV